MTFQLMITCLADVLRPGVGQATVRLLRRLGHEVTFPESQTCCGQPLYNSGFADLARAQARHTIAAFAGDDPVVTPSGSCAAMVKVEYPELLTEDPVWGDKARALAERTYELSDLLVNRLGVTDVGARYDGTVAYHSACHLRMLGQQSEVDTLLAHVAGLTAVPLERQDQCCGFGGSFAVRYPTISTAIVDDKVRCLDSSGADAVVSTDTGCLMNLGGRLRRLGKPIKVLHLAELLAGSD